MNENKPQNYSVILPADCPPSISESANGCVFRVVKNDPPIDEDFKTHRELYPNRFFENECDACGLSVYRDKSDVHRTIRRIPSWRKKIQRIAQGELDGTMGLIAHTPTHGDSHHTWWLAFGCQVWDFFAVIEVVQPQGA